MARTERRRLPRHAVSSCADPTCLWSRRHSWRSSPGLAMSKIVLQTQHSLANLACWQKPKVWHPEVHPHSTYAATPLEPQQHGRDHYCPRRRWCLECSGSNVSTEVWSCLVHQRPIQWIECSCIPQSRHWSLEERGQHKDLEDYAGDIWMMKSIPIVGIVVTISPSLSLYRIVVFPAASKPTIKILISFFPQSLSKSLENVRPMTARWGCGRVKGGLRLALVRIYSQVGD